jgi:hypothetical protein
MKLTLLAIAVALSGALPQTPQAPQAQKNPHMYGPFRSLCGGWTAQRKDPSTGGQLGAASLLIWVEGFISGSAWTQQALNIQLKDTDPDAIAAWMDKYCADHPLDELVQGAASLVIELKGQRWPERYAVGDFPD